LTCVEGAAARIVITLRPDSVLTFGRNKSNSVVLADKQASRWHAEIAYEEGRWLVRDYGTLSGTRRNGQRLTLPAPLVNGDQVEIGEHRFVFSEGAASKGFPGRPAPELDEQTGGVSEGGPPPPVCS
jgi:pSer/pThr/pTyr-binding forkhead associated (FHA) protein